MSANSSTPLPANFLETPAAREIVTEARIAKHETDRASVRREQLVALLLQLREEDREAA